MKVIAVTGRKGGVGKSTTAGNLAAELVALGRSVLLLDADPQGSILSWAKLGDGVLSRISRPIDGLTPASFKKMVQDLGKSADRIIIDTPPGFTEPALLAMAVADLVLLPVGPSPLDIVPAGDALRLAREARKARGGRLPKIALVPSKIVRTKLGGDLTATLEAMGEKVLPGVGLRSVVAEAALSGLTVREAATRSTAAEEFSALAQAVEEMLT
jgi:chromosome partitioning protein